MTTPRALTDYRDEFPVLETQGLPDQRVPGTDLGARPNLRRRVPRRLGLEGRARPRVDRGHLPDDGGAEALVRCARRVRRGRGRDHDEHLDRAIHDRLVPGPVGRAEPGRSCPSSTSRPTATSGWRGPARRGAEIVWLRSPDGLTIPLEAYDEAIDDRTAIVMVNRVLYRSSAIVDAKEVCAIARERGALSFVDDYHGIGIVPLDLHDLGCDLYTAGILKWLCGGPGMAFLYARRELLPTLEPAVTGWFGTRRAVLVRHAAPRVPPDRPAARARDPAGARLLPRAGWARDHRGGRRSSGSASDRASSPTT